MRKIFKILLWYYQREISDDTDTVDMYGNFYSHKLSRIIDCLQYIIDSLGDEK